MARPVRQFEPKITVYDNIRDYGIKKAKSTIFDFKTETPQALVDATEGRMTAAAAGPVARPARARAKPRANAVATPAAKKRGRPKKKAPAPSQAIVPGPAHSTPYVFPAAVACIYIGFSVYLNLGEATIVRAPSILLNRNGRLEANPVYAHTLFQAVLDAIRTGLGPVFLDKSPLPAVVRNGVAQDFCVIPYLIHNGGYWDHDGLYWQIPSPAGPSFSSPFNVGVAAGPIPALQSSNYAPPMGAVPFLEGDSSRHTKRARVTAPEDARIEMSDVEERAEIGGAAVNDETSLGSNEEATHSEQEVNAPFSVPLEDLAAAAQTSEKEDVSTITAPESDVANSEKATEEEVVSSDTQDYLRQAPGDPPVDGEDEHPKTPTEPSVDGEGERLKTPAQATDALPTAEVADDSFKPEAVVISTRADDSERIGAESAQDVQDAVKPPSSDKENAALQPGDAPLEPVRPSATTSPRKKRTRMDFENVEDWNIASYDGPLGPIRSLPAPDNGWIGEDISNLDFEVHAGSLWPAGPLSALDDDWAGQDITDAAVQDPQPECFSTSTSDGSSWPLEDLTKPESYSVGEGGLDDIDPEITGLVDWTHCAETEQ